MVLRNGTNKTFVDISSENFRQYTFPHGEVITILNPIFLNVGENGHRILDNEGYSYYIPKGWIQLKWKVKDNEPHFVA